MESIRPVEHMPALIRKQQVAQIRGSPVYVITSVALIPLSSQLDAEKAIGQAKRDAQRKTSDQAEGASIDSRSPADEGSNQSEGHVVDNSPEESKALAPQYSNTRLKPQEEDGSVARDVMGRRGQYGRFAERWFSKKGWTTERRRVQGMSASDMGKSEAIVRGQEGNQNQFEDVTQQDSKDTQTSESPSSPRPGSSPAQNVTNTLLPKLLRTTQMLFASRSFFYSYDYDITRRLGAQTTMASNLPLHRSVDPMFFWNHHLVLPFIENGDHAYILPLMQGFVGQRSFGVDQTFSKDPSGVISEAQKDVKDIIETQKRTEAASSFLLTLISRRSVKRPGLRYLRRGIDEEGHTANSVETEQILSRFSWKPSDNIYSFTQFRGSIPLFFSQSPYALKPIPVLQHGFETNHAAFKRHFIDLIGRYGDVQIVLLVNKQGEEADIGQQYEEHTKRLVAEGGINGVRLDFEWFDFHAVCRGMRFENVSVLVDTLDNVLDQYDTTVEVNREVQKRQKGVLRINCMDCLDRTNVVQSACASRTLEKQLKEEGVELNLQTDTTTQWFNTLWADNGDAISKQYASTAALKGDYTRTRRRDYRGALNDFGLTMSRYYNNIVNDYFSQAAIDYLLGNVTEQVFEEFEADMMSNDPAISMQKLRSNAIDTSSKIVIAEQREDLVGGWTLLSPKESNTVRTLPFEEVILLLTDAALYAVRFDWNLEKVSSFERVDLRSVTGIIHGSYVTSTLTAIQTDENKNVGLVIKYRPGKEDIAKVNTRTLSTAAQTDSEPDSAHTAAIARLFDPSGSGRSSPQARDKSSKRDSQNLKLLAFKALPARTSLANVGGQKPDTVTVSEKELVRGICDDIRRAAYGGDGGGSDTGFERGFVEEQEIISLKEARRSTGYLEQWGHELKKLIWA
ncbi:MAG: hypothetical protein Q9213_000837 [Squamulea squamosa]